MTKQADKVREALKDAMARGWERIPASPGCVTLRWSVELPTPERVRTAGWWPGETYDEITFVTFIGVERISAVANPTPGNPWVGRRESNVSVKRALELLASLGTDKLEPAAEAPTELVVEEQPAVPVVPEQRREPATLPEDSRTGQVVEQGMRIRLTRVTSEGHTGAYEGTVTGVHEGGLILIGRRVGGDSIHSAFATGNQIVYPRSGVVSQTIEILDGVAA